MQWLSRAAGTEKIVTIENKTNYLAMEYDPEILYIYSHGYFSPLEREFLKKLQRVIEGKTWKYSTAEIWITVESGF